MTPRSTFANANQESRSVQMSDTSRRSIDYGSMMVEKRGAFHSMLAARIAISNRYLYALIFTIGTAVF
jgi:hypothetical protein